MTYEFSSRDVEHDIPNPYRIENIFLGISAIALIVSGSFVLLTAKVIFDVNKHIALVAVSLAFLMFGTGVKFGVQALSQLRFFAGRSFPIGLAPELKPSAQGTSEWAEYVQDKLRSRSIHFIEPEGPMNGLLYTLIKPLITAPPQIQVAAIKHFHAIVGMAAMLVSMSVSWFLFQGNASEGVISWLYLPLTGLSLATPFIKKEDDDNTPPKPEKLLWSLVSLIAFAILSPVLVDKYLPHWTIAPMWIAPLAMLVTSLIGSMIFLASLLDQIDGLAQTDVSFEQTTIAMNCAPAQLWAEIGRDFRNNWVRDVPNRTYINLPPDAAPGDRGSFQGHILEETHPLVTSTMKFDSIGEAIAAPHARYLVLLGIWGVILSMLTGAVGYWLSQGFADMSRFEISRSVLTVIGLSISNVMGFKAGHLLWSRMHFTSRLVWIETQGTFQTSELDVGNNMTGRVRSRNKLTRIEDATLRVWVADVVSIVFGKDGGRFVASLSTADGVARSIVERLKTFATEQSSIVSPTSSRDLAKVKTLLALENEVNHPALAGRGL